MTNPIDTCDACQVQDAPTPEAVSNRPGLSEIRYRVGTYATFRQAMLRSIHQQPALKDWTTRHDDDFGIALFDMWAYVLDILTFYQERIANEAYLKTAAQPESLRRLTSLINYTPTPGKAASVYLAFLLQPPTPSLLQTTITPRLRVQSIPGPNEKPQKFETEETRLTKFAWNALDLVQFQPQPLFRGKKSLFLKGRQPSIKPGDWLLLVGDEKVNHPNLERWDLRPISEVTFSDTQTELCWIEGLGSIHALPAAQNPKAYILRNRASLFGFNAPMQPQTFTSTTTYHYEDSDDPTKVTSVTGSVTASDPIDWDFARPEQGEPVIYLDTEYPKLAAGDWLALDAAGVYTELYRVRATTTEHHSAYSMSGKSTRVQMDSSENLNRFYADLAARKTAVLFGAEEFTIDLMPIDDPFLHAGSQTILVNGDQSGLEVGRPLLIQGPTDNGDVQTDTVTIAAVSVTGDQTTITTTEPLAHTYPLATVTIYANVIYATHGETTTEVLGNGDAATPFETFTLKKAPVTYVPQASAPNGAASTLQVRVNDMLWDEVASFYGRGPVEAIYTSSLVEGKRVVRGGDGQTGQRFPTGKNNVTATYRIGIGEVGNVNAGVLTTLLDRPAGVKKVLNPLAAEGGADPETPEEVRTNAPNTVRTFGRIVSMTDFEDSARQYPGIAKARAEQIWNGDERLVRLTVARDGGAPMPTSGTLYTELLAYLDSRRDPNRALELQDYTQRPIILQAKVYIDVPKYVPEDVYKAAIAAITELFDFGNLNLGQPVYLADVMATLQHVDGVVAVDVDRFMFKGDLVIEGSDVLDATPVYPNELITLENPASDLLLTPISGIKGTQL